MQAKQVDIFGLAEINVNFHHPGLTDEVSQIAKRNWTHVSTTLVNADTDCCVWAQQGSCDENTGIKSNVTENMGIPIKKGDEEEGGEIMMVFFLGLEVKTRVISRKEVFRKKLLCFQQNMVVLRELISESPVIVFRY